PQRLVGLFSPELCDLIGLDAAGGLKMELVILRRGYYGALLARYQADRQVRWLCIRFTREFSGPKVAHRELVTSAHKGADVLNHAQAFLTSGLHGALIKHSLQSCPGRAASEEVRPPPPILLS